jgi:hypothetical protein
MGGITRPATPLKPIAEESLERFVTERIEVSDDELRKLALERAETVKTELQKRGIDAERLFARTGQNFANGDGPPLISSSSRDQPAGLHAAIRLVYETVSFRKHRPHHEVPGAAKPQPKGGLSRAKTQRAQRNSIVISTEGRNLSEMHSVARA